MQFKFKKKTLFMMGYVLAILAWFSFSNINGIDMLAYAKSGQTVLSKSAPLYHK
jgi:hypothetical protein